MVRTATSGGGRRERSSFPCARSCAGVDLIFGMRDNGRLGILLAEEGRAMAINTHGVVVVQTTEHAGRLAGGSHSLCGVSGWVVSATSDVAGVCEFAA